MSPLSLAVGFVPVVLFLIALMALDSYRLVGHRQVLVSIGWGALAAVLAFLLNRAVLGGGLDPVILRRYVAPAIEEPLKAALVLALVRRGRVGFLVDAGILGFAAGTGFALVENAWYAHALGEPSPWLWVLRGLGTAVLHGSTTGMAGILAKAFADRLGARAALVPLPGLALAIAVHAAYNLLVLNPLLATAILLVVAPLVLLATFELSERATREWLGHGFDRDAELLELIHQGTIVHTPAGDYLSALRERFAGPVVADMLCLLEIRLELALRAKGLLLARAAGVEVPPDPRVRAHLAELRHLERTIGPTGRLALHPLLPEGRERWQIGLLQGGAGQAPRARDR
jgi:RsiW-degrading membrane proteinase PrsW (M82 family)